MSLLCIYTINEPLSTFSITMMILIPYCDKKVTNSEKPPTFATAPTGESRCRITGPYPRARRFAGQKSFMPLPSFFSCHPPPPTTNKHHKYFIVSHLQPSKPFKKNLKHFSPWTADVQGPLLNSCVMKVVKTIVKAHPVKNPADAPCAFPAETPPRHLCLPEPKAFPAAQTSSFANISHRPPAPSSFKKLQVP